MVSGKVVGGGVAALLASLLAVAGCEAVANTGALTERSTDETSGSGGSSSGVGSTTSSTSSTGGTTATTGGGTTGTTGGGTTGTTGTGTTGGTSSGTTKTEVLPPGPTGYVDDSQTTGIVGAWYAFGDMWGPTGRPPGNCQTMGGFMDSQCSTITFPMAPPDGGSSTFPPDSLGRMCLKGTAAKVINKGTIPDYSDIFGIGMAFDFNDSAGTQMPWDATKAHVTGFEFDISGVPAGGIRVEFPTVQTMNGFQDSYSITVAGDGHYQADLTSDMTDAHPLKPAFTPPTGMTEPSFDPTKLMSINFHVATNTSGAIPVSQMCVATLTALISM
jgi:hypothetical protein